MKARNAVLAAGIVGLIAATVVAKAAGLFDTYPIVGAAAFCSTTNTAGVPGTASVCTTTTPAGPSVVTGLETVPADTNAAQGVPPQTVQLTMASLNSLPISVQALTPATATNAISATATMGGVLITASAALSPTDISLPPSPIDKQRFYFSSQQVITTGLHISGQGTATVANAPTAITPTTTGPFGYQFMYDAASDTWHRLQ